jgi:opacity protein-like surface antigen
LLIAPQHLRISAGPAQRGETMKAIATLAAAGATAALLLAGPASAQNRPLQPLEDKWTFSVMPYLWLPSIDGKLNYGPPPPGGATANVELDAGNYLDNLEFAAMVTGQARKGRFLIATDLIYLDFDKQDSSVRSVDLNPGGGPINISTSTLNAGTESSLKGWLWTLVGGYAAVADPRWNLDVIGGFRMLSLDVDTSWQLTANVTGTGPGGGTATFARSGSVAKSDTVWAAIVGVKGRIRLGEGDWFANYYLDAGGGSDVFTWQGAAGVGYAFKWGEVLLDYRYLYYNQGDQNLIDNLSFGGLGLGVNFRF